VQEKAPIVLVIEQTDRWLLELREVIEREGYGLALREFLGVGERWAEEVQFDSRVAEAQPGRVSARGATGESSVPFTELESVPEWMIRAAVDLPGKGERTASARGLLYHDTGMQDEIAGGLVEGIDADDVLNALRAVKTAAEIVRSVT